MRFTPAVLGVLGFGLLLTLVWAVAAPEVLFTEEGAKVACPPDNVRMCTTDIAAVVARLLIGAVDTVVVAIAVAAFAGTADR